MLCSLALKAQDGAMIKFYEKYAGDERFTRVNISSKMFSMMADLEMEEEEDKEIMEAMSSLEGLKILAGENLPNARKMFEEALKIPGAEYHELMTVHDDEDHVVFLVKEDANGDIRELLLLVGSETEFVVLSMVGNIDLKNLSKLSGKIEMKGLDQLENLPKD